MDKAVACNVIDCFGAIIADEISQQDSQSVVVPRVMQTMAWVRTEIIYISINN